MSNERQRARRRTNDERKHYVFTTKTLGGLFGGLLMAVSVSVQAAGSALPQPAARRSRVPLIRASLAERGGSNLSPVA